MGKNKNKNKNKFIQAQSAPKPLDVSTSEKIEEAVSKIAASTNETDFESKKVTLLEALRKQIEDEKTKAQEELETMKIRFMLSRSL